MAIVFRNDESDASVIVDRPALRSVVRDAWKRSERYRIDRNLKVCPVLLSGNDLEKLFADNEELLQAGGEVIENIYGFDRGAEIVVMLIDRNGFILRVVGDAIMLSRTDRIGVRPGGCWAESVMGANAVGTSLMIDSPLQLHGSEHWCKCASVGLCSSAPIHDPDTKEIIGIINLTGLTEKMHEHSLGMVVAGAGWIEKEIATRRNEKKAWLTVAQQSAIIESVTNGLFALDESNDIVCMNRIARRMLHIPEYVALAGLKLDDVLDRGSIQELIRLYETDGNVKDEPITVWVGSYKQDFIINMNSFCDQNNEPGGKVFVIQDTARIREIAKKVSSSAPLSFEDLIGVSDNFTQCVEKAKRAARTSSNILLTGESGVGKDVIAQAIHNRSARSKGSFITVNCAAIPKDLLATELFGYEEGAFTGAKKGGAKGKFELASGGTLFLDEIGEMSLDMQSSLLRVLEAKEMMRVGGQGAIPVDARIITATNRNLKDMVDDGQFRLDLYYRINVVWIEIPALRERKADIPLLSDMFYRKISADIGSGHRSGISPEVKELFMRYDWPGNIRELQNIIESVLNTCNSDREITIDMLPNGQITEDLRRDLPPDSSLIMQMNLSLIHSYMKKYDGNKSRVAKVLGVSRSTLYRLLNEKKV